MSKERISRLCRKLKESCRLLIFHHQKLYKSQIPTISLAAILVAGVLLANFFEMSPFVEAASRSDHYRVIVIDGSRRYVAITQASNVEAVLGELKLDVVATDSVIPARTTPINSQDFVIDVRRGNFVVVVDGDLRHAGAWTSAQSPRAIAVDLGHRLGEGDIAVWDNYSFDKDGLMRVQSVKILRNQTYQLNLNGQIVKKQSRYRRVDRILRDWGHSLEKIAYVNPALGSRIDKDQAIVLYYQQPQTKIDIQQRPTTANVSDQPTVFAEEVFLVDQNNQRHMIDRRHPSSGAASLKVAEQPSTSTALATASLTIAKNVDHQHGTPSLTNRQKTWLRSANIARSDWVFVDYIITKESNWRYNVWNQQGSSAYGLCQTLLSIYRGEISDDFMHNPVAQLKWCHQYAQQRYGGWHDAYHFWLRNKWW